MNAQEIFIAGSYRSPEVHLPGAPQSLPATKDFPRVIRGEPIVFKVGPFPTAGTVKLTVTGHQLNGPALFESEVTVEAGKMAEISIPESKTVELGENCYFYDLFGVFDTGSRQQRQRVASGSFQLEDSPGSV